MVRTSFFRIGVLVAAFAVLGCTETGPTGPETTDPVSTYDGAEGDLLGLPIFRRLRLNLALCWSQPYDSTSAVIGPEGGIIRAGNHEFRVPRGAVREPVEITMVSPGDWISSARFYPEGYEFTRREKPELTLSTRNCLLPLAPQMVYIDEDFRVLEVLRVLRLLNFRREVTSEIDHFSRYAVAW